MEHENFAESLRIKANEQRKKQLEHEDALAREKSVTLRTAEYMSQHKQEFINKLIENAKTAANRNELSASLNYRERIEHMYSFFQTMIAVRDYFRHEGFEASIESGDDGIWSPRGQEKPATSCWAQVTIDWSHQ